MRGDGRVFQRGNFWWISYYHNGREVREAAKHVRTGKKIPATEKEQDQAQKYLKHRLGQIAAEQNGGRPFAGPKAERVTVTELVDALESDLRLRGKLSVETSSNLKPLRAHFGEMRASEVTATRVTAYIEILLAEGYARASVNRRTQLLGQAYKLALRQCRLSQTPFIPRLSEMGNARTGFFTEPEIRRVVSHFRLAKQESLADVTLFGFLSGWRKGEILTLTWGDVDGDAIRLRAEHSKNGHGRVLVLAGELAKVIERRRGLANGPLIFHHAGEPIVDFRKAWATAAKHAQVPGRLFHDLRRSAVRNMIRAGVPEKVAMEISGHRTHSMLNRYNIVSEGDLRQAVERTADYLRAQAETASEVKAKGQTESIQ
jgi:integrase